MRFSLSMSSDAHLKRLPVSKPEERCPHTLKDAREGLFVGRQGQGCNARTRDNLIIGVLQNYSTSRY
jgi:hypothetical protein